MADVYVPIRSGTDIAFEQNDGLFDGFDPETQLYDLETGGWAYQRKARYCCSKGDEAARIEKDESLEHPRCVFRSCAAILLAILRNKYPESVAAGPIRGSFITSDYG